MIRGSQFFQDEPKSLLEHMEDLRLSLIGCLVSLVLGMAIALPLAPTIFRWLTIPLQAVTDHPERFLKSIVISGGFSIMMQITFWSGLSLSSPFLILFIARFISPGLISRERRVLFGAVFAAFILFAAGVVIGYVVALPVALRIMFQLHTWLGIQVDWTAPSYIAFASQVLIAFGLAFELPLVLFVLGLLGIVTSEQLRNKRRHAIVIILTLAAFLTPGPDVFSQLTMAIPMIILYEVCIHLVRLTERKSIEPPSTQPEK